MTVAATEEEPGHRPQRRALFCGFLLAMMLATTTATTVAAAGSAMQQQQQHPKWVPSSSSVNKQLPGRYIIEFSDDYTGSTQEFMDEMAREHQTFRWTMAHDYDKTTTKGSSIFRGISIHLEEQQGVHAANKANYMSEHQVMRHVMDKQPVKRVFPVVEVPRPKLHRHNILSAQELDLSPNVHGLPFSHAMTQVNRVHSELGLDGSGILVGIIDTGVDYNHPSLGGGFGPGYKVVKGYDLVGDNLDISNPASINPSRTPLDTCAGHGTHVAGIIAAEDDKYNFTGVAPKATLGMWRIFGCHGSTSNDLVIKALIMAYEADCNVINLSLGGPNSWPEDPTSVVADKIAQRNVTVVVAGGNEGDSGIYMISSPSTGYHTISVASVDNEYSLHPIMHTDNSTQQFPYALSSSTTSFPNGTLVAYSNSSNTDHDACNGTQPVTDLQGAIVLVQRGACPFDEKAAMVAQHGGAAAIIYDSQGIDTFVPSTEGATIPVAAVSHKAGLALLDNIQQTENVTVTFNLVLSQVPVGTGGHVSGFSSLGPTSEVDLKPDIAAVGGYVFSTLPLSQGGYGTLSGTSMASPYIAGVTALYKQAHGTDADSVLVRRQMQIYANMTSVQSTGQLDNPIRQGAGLVQAYDAIQGHLYLDQTKLSFNDTVRRTPQTFTVTNRHDRYVEYELKNVPSVAIAPYDVSIQGFAPLQPARNNEDITAELAFSKHTMRLAPGESCTVDVSVDTVDKDDTFYPIFGGAVQLVDPSSGDVHATVPYVGVEGNLTQLPIFATGFPLLANRDDLGLPVSVIAEEESFERYVLDRTAPPTAQNASVLILSRYVTGTAHMVAEVLDVDGNVLGVAYQGDYVERNVAVSHGFLNVNVWNGSYVPVGFETVHNSVPVAPGTYHLQWRALKLLADPALPESWEVVTSPQIFVT